MSVLDCRDLSFAYEGRPVLSHVNFSLEKGSYLGFICRMRRRGWATCRSSRP